MQRIGLLMGGGENDPLSKTNFSAFARALTGLGWTEGLRIDLRWVGGDINRIRALAQELAGSQPDIIVTNMTPATVALQRETRTIPIVFDVADPVASVIVARLDRPGGNVTGFSFMGPSFGGKWIELLSEIAPGLKRAAIMFNPDTAPASAYMPSLDTAARSLKIAPNVAPVQLIAKQLELLHEAVPDARVIGFLVNPNDPNAAPDTKDAQVAATAHGVGLRLFPAASAGEFEQAFATISRERIGVLLVGVEPFFWQQRQVVAGTAASTMSRPPTTAISFRRSAD